MYLQYMYPEVIHTLSIYTCSMDTYIPLISRPLFLDNVELTSNKERRFTCPGDQVTFTCRVVGSVSLEWRSPLITQTTSYGAIDTPPAPLIRGPFTAFLIGVSGTNLNANFNSTLEVTASRMILSTQATVTCLSSTPESETDNFTTAGTLVILILCII